MRRTSFEDLHCSVAQCLEVVGEWWSLLVLRDVFLGVTRFDDLRNRLGISRNVLTERLEHLVAHGVLERVPYQQHPVRYDYRLTDKGMALLPTMVALRQWGERWETGVPATPVLVDARDMRRIRPIEVLSHDGRVLGKMDMHWALPEDVVGDDEPLQAAAE